MIELARTSGWMIDMANIESVFKDVIKVKKSLLSCNTKEQLINAEKMIALIQNKYKDKALRASDLKVFIGYISYLIGVHQTVNRLKFNDNGKGE